MFVDPYLAFVSQTPALQHVGQDIEQISYTGNLGVQRAAMLGWPNCLGKNEPFKAAGSSSVNDLPKRVIKGKDSYSVLYSLCNLDLFR